MLKMGVCLQNVKLLVLGFLEKKRKSLSHLLLSFAAIKEVEESADLG